MAASSSSYATFFATACVETALAFCTIAYVREFLYDWSLLSGPSMQPTFTGDLTGRRGGGGGGGGGGEGGKGKGRRGGNLTILFKFYSECVIVDRTSSARDALKRGDLVMARHVEDPSKVICKRVYGLEGDTVKWDKGLRNSWLRGASTQYTIPKGHVWLLGDNPEASHDSRFYGAVPRALVTGVVVYQVLPWEKARHIK